jgi:mono/diheme cytochrome c family protein
MKGLAIGRPVIGMAAVAAVTAASFGFGMFAQADDSSFTSTAGIGTVTGQQIYEHICQGCHMPNAQGATGAGFYPKLAGDKKLISWQYVAVTVLNGKNGMPPFGFPADQVVQLRTTHLSDQQVADVVNYLRSHFDNKFAATVTAAQVAALPHPVTETRPF